MICRLCLSNLSIENAEKLFSNSDESELIKIIAKYLMLEITENDSVSTNVCSDCSMHLNDFHKFCTYVEEKQNSLRNEFLEVKCSIDAPSKIVEPLIANNEESLLDIKDIFIECETEVREVPEEEFSCASNFDNSNNKTVDDDIDDDDDGDAGADDDDIPLKKLKGVSDANRFVRKDKSSKSRKTLLHSKTVKLKKKLFRSKSKVLTAATKNTSNVKKKTSKLKVTKSSEASDKKNDELIARYLQLKCDICEISMETFASLRTHFKNIHNCNGYVTCCGRRFQKRFELVEHINMHLNPNCFQCKLCSKNLKTKYSLDMHMQNRHTKREELEYVCPTCGKRFASKNNLKTHSLAHETERNYPCNLCEKAFVTQYRLNAHIKAIHENIIPHICDYCGREFKFKPSFDQHVAEHQGLNRDPPVQCNVCGEWFKHKYGLRKHMKRHNTVQIEVECEQCGRICPTKVALQSHIRNTHNRESNLKCSFCEKTFKLKRSLNEHIAIHTGEKHNPCPHCPKEFRSKANMYVHIKRDHFEEWSKKRSKPPLLPVE